MAGCSVATASSGTIAPEAERVFRLPIQFRVLAIRGIALRNHLEGVAQQVDVVDVGAGQIGLQRRVHIAHRHAEHLGLVAIDHRIQRRIARVEVAEGLRRWRDPPLAASASWCTAASSAR